MLVRSTLGFDYLFSSKRTTFALFSATVLLFALADGIFSYQVPIWLESIFQNVALVGLVLSSSSAIGFLCDLSFPTLFARRNYRFFFVLTFIIGLSTQLIGLLSSAWVAAFIVMALWGVYYELFIFGLYHFLHTEIEPAQHADGWGVAEALRSIALVTAPLLAGALFVLQINPFQISGVLFGCALCISLVLYVRKKRTTKDLEQNPSKTFSFATFKVWSVFLKRIWPVYLFFFSLIVFDATVWSVGIFFAEELRHSSTWGAFFVPAYVLPTLLVPLVAGKLGRRFGKKRSAFAVAIPFSLVLLLGHWVVRSPLWHVGVMLVAGCCSGLILTESEAIFEDYVARLHRFSSEMIGLVRSASSMGYIVGPLLAGLLAHSFGSARTLALMGIVPGIAGVIAMILMRGKTRLPQQELEKMVA